MISYFLLLLVASSTCLVRVNSPSQFAKDYMETKLKLYPTTFNVTAPIVIGNPFDGCSSFTNADQMKGKIVVVLEAGACLPQEKTRRIFEAEGVGAVLAGAQGTLGLYYNYGYDPDPSVQLPALSTSQQQFQDVINYVNANPSENVTVTIVNTDANPWLEYGDGPAGILFQIYFQLLAGSTLVIAAYKLRYYIEFKGFVPHVPHICLGLEIGAAILRMIYMLRPLSFYYWGFSIVGDAFLSGYSNDLSFMTDLLITFYWQEILVKCNRQLSNKILNNLDKFRIPFAIACIIIWALDTVANLARGLIIRSFSNAIVFSAIIYVIFSVFIAAFFFYTGFRVLKATSSAVASVSHNRKERRVSKLMKIILATGSLLILQIIASFLEISPAANISAPGNVTIFWLWWTGLYGASLSKVLMFETPRRKNSDASLDKGSPSPSSKTTDIEMKSDSSTNQDSSVESAEV